MSLVHVLQDAEEGAVVLPRPSRSRLKPQPPDIVQVLKKLQSVILGVAKTWAARAPRQCVTRKFTHIRGLPANSSVKIEPAREKHLSRTSWMHIVVTNRYSTNSSTANAQYGVAAHKNLSTTRVRSKQKRLVLVLEATSRT